MKKTVLFLLVASSGWAVVPTKVEWFVGPETDNISPTQYQAKTVNPTASGDCLVLGCTIGSATDRITSVIDNKGGFWKEAVAVADGGNGQSLDVWYSTGTPVGVSSITAVLSANTNFGQCAVIALNNIATGNSVAENTCGKHTSGTTLGCGAMNNATAGDEIVTFTLSDGSTPNVAVHFTTATTGMAMWGNDSSGLWAGTYGNQAGTGVVDSSITASSSMNSMITAGVSLKTASGGGSAGTGIYVKQMTNINFNQVQTYSGVTSFSMDFPVNDPTINLLATCFHTSGGIDVSAVTSSPANVWVSSENASGNNHVYCVYASNAVTNSTMTITYATTDTPSATSKAFTASIWGISGASTTPLDNTCSNFFVTTQTSGTINAQPTCQTSSSNELLLAHQQEDRQTVTNGGPGTYMPGDSGGAYSSFKYWQDGGVSHYYVPVSSAVNVNWQYSYYEGGAAIGNNTGMAIAFFPVPPFAASSRGMSIRGGKVTVR